MAHKANEMTNNIEVALLGETTMHVREEKQETSLLYRKTSHVLWDVSFWRNNVVVLIVL